MPILRSSDSVADKDMMSKYGQMGKQLSDCVENIVTSNFSFFPQCFPKLSVVDASKRVSME